MVPVIKQGAGHLAMLVLETNDLFISFNRYTEAIPFCSSTDEEPLSPLTRSK